MENNTDVGKGWIILQKELLLAEINGTIFSPERFAQHHDVSNSTGVVPLSKIKEVFPTHDPESIAGLLCHLQYCHEIGETEAALISQGLSSNTSEKYFFFPALVQIDRSTEACQMVTRNHLRCGWILQSRRTHEFLSPRFLHVLLLRLAFTFGLHDEAEEGGKVYPVLQRRCNVWRCGIHWVNRDGVEAVVEVVQQNTAVVMVMNCLDCIIHNVGGGRTASKLLFGTKL